MTAVAMLAKLRALLDESAAGFWTDAQLYIYLDSAQSVIVTELLNRQRQLKLAQGQYKEIEALKPLIKSINTIATSTSPIISLSTVTDLLEIYQAILTLISSGAELVMNYVPLNEQKLRKLNTYTGHSYDTTTKTGQVYCSLYQGNLITSFTTFPNVDYDKLLLYYYAQPATVTASQNYTLPSETHEAGILIAGALAKYQDGKKQEGDSFYQQGLQQLANI